MQADNVVGFWILQHVYVYLLNHYQPGTANALLVIVEAQRQMF